MILDPLLDLFRGRAVTIPPLDGNFRPNARLDDADILATLRVPDNLVSTPERLLATSGRNVLAIRPGGEPEAVASFESEVTALAVSPAGELVAALASGRLFIGDRELAMPRALRCITALAFRPDGVLLMTNGSDEHSPAEWAADLMRKRSTGSLWGREPGGGAFREIAVGLAFPNGIHVDDDGIVVSESWRHRLIRIDRQSGRRLAAIVDHLPGYPARLSPASDGGAWLSIFAPRNRLVEFVLQEDDYRQDMLAEIPPDFWIAPALSSRRSFLEPLQCGAIKTMGVHKPWSPSRSYGLVVRLDANMRPLSSLHSRADGMRHGICSAVEHGGRLTVASKGGNCILTVPLAGQGR